MTSAAMRLYVMPLPPNARIAKQPGLSWHYLKKKRRKLWIWKALDRDAGQLLDWECGQRDKATLQKMVDRLAKWDVKMYYTDKWATSASIIPQDKLTKQPPMRSNGITLVRSGCASLPDDRLDDTTLALTDALMSAFALCSLKAPSLLAFDCVWPAPPGAGARPPTRPA
jgi:hypothetical protein